MCYSTVKDKNLDKINKGRARDRKKPTVVNLELFKPSYKLSAFNHDNLPVFKEPDTLDFLSWGFIQPTGADDKDSAEIKFMTANAKCETIFDKKLYQKAIFEKRCIIAVDGFFEWRHVNKKTFPHYIYHASEPILFIGGIWNRFTDTVTGESKETVSMITTAANPMMEVIHNMKKRMPFILDHKVAFDWLNPDLTQGDLVDFMQPYPEDKMKFHTVGRKLNPESDETVEKVAYPELSNEQQSLF